MGSSARRNGMPSARCSALTLAAQVALHLVYGDETFLYAAHFLPLLMALAVFAARSLSGPVAASIALLTAGLAAFNNAAMYAAAARLLQQAQSSEERR